MTSGSVTEVAEAGGRETEGGWSVPLQVCHVTRDGCTILQHMLIFYFHSTTDHCCSEEHVEEHTPSLTSATS